MLPIRTKDGTTVIISEANPYQDELGRFTTGGGTISATDFENGGGASAEITNRAEDIYMTPAARRAFERESAKNQSYQDFKNYMKRNGVAVESFPALEAKANVNYSELTDSLKLSTDHHIAAFEQYKALGGIDTITRIKLWDENLQSQGVYDFQAVGEKWSKEIGTISTSSSANVFHVLHEYAHAYADSSIPKSSRKTVDVIKQSSTLNKIGKLLGDAKAYFGASASAYEAERFADYVGHGLRTGQPERLEFIARVASYVQGANP